MAEKHRTSFMDVPYRERADDLVDMLARMYNLCDFDWVAASPASRAIKLPCYTYGQDNNSYMWIGGRNFVSNIR